MVRGHKRDLRVRPKPDFLGHYEILHRDSPLEDLGPFLPAEFLDETQILMSEKHPAGVSPVLLIIPKPSLLLLEDESDEERLT